MMKLASPPPAPLTGAGAADTADTFRLLPLTLPPLSLPPPPAHGKLLRSRA
jgi:hypothetical protein